MAMWGGCMRKGKKTEAICTILGSGASIEGTLEFQGTIRVDGQVKGRICSDGGTVIIGERAVVNAKIIVDVAIIMGEVYGTIDARDRIEIYPPGRMKGDIRAPIVSIEKGSIFHGHCAMKVRAISNRRKAGSPDANRPEPKRAVNIDD